MDSKKFDELIARLASGASRRETVKGALGGALAAAGITALAADSEAKRKRALNNGGKHKGKGKGKGKKGCNKISVCHRVGRYGTEPVYERKRICRHNLEKHLEHGDCRPSKDYGCTC
jgi:hypothetical protein